MNLPNNPTPAELIQSVKELEKVKPPFSNIPLHSDVVWIRQDTILLKNQPFINGDTYLLTFFLGGGETHSNCYINIIYVVNTNSRVKDNNKGEAALYYIKGFSNTEYSLEIYFDIVSKCVMATTTCSDLFLLRSGLIPSFGSVGSLYT